MAVPGCKRNASFLASNLRCQESLDEEDFSDVPVHKRLRPDCEALGSISYDRPSPAPVLESADFECSICQDVLIDPVVGESGCNPWPPR